MLPIQAMIPLLLGAALSPQIDGFDLDEFLASHTAPSVQEIMERLGPVPEIDVLLDPDRDFEPPPKYQQEPDDHSEELVLRLEELASWTAKVNTLRIENKLLESAQWAGMQTSERLELLPAGHHLIAHSYGLLSFALYNINRNRESRDMTLAALDIELEEFGRISSRVRESLLRLSKRSERLGDLATGETALRHALDIAILGDGPSSKNTARFQSNLGAKLSSVGKNFEAIELYERSLELYEELDGPSSNSVAILCANLAQILIPLGDTEPALDLLTRAVDIHRDLDQLESRAGIVCMLVTSSLCPPTQALEYLEEAMAMAEVVFKPEDPIWPTALNQYGWGLVQARLR